MRLPLALCTLPTPAFALPSVPRPPGALSSEQIWPDGRRGAADE